MLGIKKAIELVQSDAFLSNAEVGRIELADPLSESELSAVGEQLPPDLFETVSPLLQVTGGFDVFGRETPGKDPVVSVGLQNFLPDIWARAYPLSAEIAAFDEVLYWDLQGSPPGVLFFVDHDGPCHCHAFDSFPELLEALIASSADYLFDALKCLSTGEPRNLPISAFKSGDADATAFAERFPAYYSIHDLRGSRIGDYFEYGLGGPDGIARFGGERLFAQRQPGGWLEGFRWWWNPNLPLSLQPVEITFPPFSPGSARVVR